MKRFPRGQMERHVKIAGLYLATLKAIYLIHQHSHWTTKGSDFYGNHLLFERLYEAAQKSADEAAEKFIRVFSEDALDLGFQNELLEKVLAKFKTASEDPTERSIAAEKQFLQLSQQAYDAFKADEVMTLGMDDMIMSIANKSEEAVYLLQQSLKKQGKQMDESEFLKKVLAVLQKQQVILKKLAQDGSANMQNNKTEIESYLKSAWQTAGLNVGITQMSTPNVTYTAGAGLNSTDGSLINTSESYTVTGVIPANVREKFNAVFLAQIKAQKPELDGKVNAIYTDA